MNYFIKFDQEWLTGKTIDNGWQAAFNPDPRFAKAFKSEEEAQEMIQRLANYKVKAEIVAEPYSCPA